jgi:hypothetical protein
MERGRKKEEPGPQVIPAPFPMKGLNTVLASYRRDLTTSQSLRNVRGVEPTTDRKRGSQRGGLTREFDRAVSSWVQHINHMVLAIGEPSEELSGEFEGINKWWHSAIPANASIYSMPARAGSLGYGILKIDPAAETGAVIAEATLTGITDASVYYTNPIVAPNGSIYAHVGFLPDAASLGSAAYYPYAFLKINPVADTAAFLTWTPPGALATTALWHNPSFSQGPTILAPNGCIYIISGDVAVTKIDTATDVVSRFGSITYSSQDSLWSHAVLVGTAIYCIPWNADYILKIETSTDTLSTFGSFGSNDTLWSHGVLAGNGKIYGIPYGSASVLKIDPLTDSATTFGSLGDISTNPAEVKYWAKWRHGVLASTGNIYGVPESYDAVLKINPTSDTVSTVGSLGEPSSPSNPARWEMGVLAANGKIYCPPDDATTVLEIDPATDTLATTGSYADPDPGTSLFRHAIRAGNDKIFSIPYDSTYLLRLV